MKHFNMMDILFELEIISKIFKLLKKLKIFKEHWLPPLEKYNVVEYEKQPCMHHIHVL